MAARPFFLLREIAPSWQYGPRPVKALFSQKSVRGLPVKVEAQKSHGFDERITCMPSQRDVYSLSFGIVAS